MVYVPICKYNSEQDGVMIQKYNDKFCEPKAFQPTFNEYGMCFTYNNRKQGMDEYFRLYHSIDDGENFSDSNANIAIKSLAGKMLPRDMKRNGAGLLAMLDQDDIPDYWVGRAFDCAWDVAIIPQQQL